MMRAAIAALLLLLPAWPSGLSLAAAAQADDRPDVLLITVDTLRADHLSAYGYPGPISPNLDRLFSSGVRFSSARTVEPLTHPSMTSMLTSMHPHLHGGTRNGLRMRSGLNSVPKILAGAGYETAAFVGNWTLKPKVSGLDEHFRTYRPVLTRKRWFGLVRSEAVSPDLTEAALLWLDEQEGNDRPVFLWVHYSDPHAPYRYHKEQGRRLGLSDATKAERSPTEVAFTDLAVGDLLAGFRSRRGPSGPIVIFCADHGESLGEHGYWGHGRHLYETELQIPMGIAWDGSIQPREIDAPASIIDLAPTLLSLLGLSTPDSFAGSDWSRVLHGGEIPEGRVTYHQTHRGAVMVRHESKRARKKGLLAVALVRDGSKEILRTESGRHLTLAVGSAPSSSRLLADDASAPGDALAAWLQAVTDGIEKNGPADQPLDEESIEKLRSLGYVD